MRYFSNRILRAMPMLLVSSLCFFCISLTNAGVLRVPHDFQSIQAAIDSAQSGDEVWVNGGTYAESITLRSGVGVYGGFSGNETSHDGRDLPLNMSILDGSNIGGRQAQHVVTMDKVTSVTLDGFVVKGGRATEDMSHTNPFPAGAGIYTSATLKAIIRNCQITENESSAESPIIYAGCAIAALNSSMCMVNSLVKKNTSSVLFLYSSAIITNCSFSEHEAMGLHGYLSDMTVQDSTFAYNSGGVSFVTNGIHPIVVDRCKFVENGSSNNLITALSFYSYNSDPIQNIVRNTSFIGNHGTALAGAVTAAGCSFIYNYNALYGGISVLDSVFCGNTRTHTEPRTPAALRNAIVVNNHEAPLSRLENCIVQDNLFTSCKAQNTVFLNNPNLASATAQNCVFSQNAVLDPSKITGSENLIVADPQFVAPRKGHWTAAPAYDAASTQTVLTDANTTFAPNELAGQIIKVNSTLTTSSCYVLSNTDHTVTVYGHAEGMAVSGNEWLIMNYHAAYGSSPCVDRGMTIPDLTTDFEGRPRPLLSGYDIGIYEYLGVEGPGGSPDLAVESMWWSDSDIYQSEDIKIGCNIRNWGDRNSTACLYAVNVDGAQVFKGNLAPVAAYGGPSIHQDISMGMLTPGKHQITVVADPDNQNSDTNRGNNALTRELTVLESADLQIVSIKVTPLLPKISDQVTVAITVRNDSGVDVPKADLRLSTGVYTNWWTKTIALAPNETKQIEFPFGELESAYYAFAATLTAQSPVHEKNNADNSKAFKFGVGKVTATAAEWMLY